MCQVEKHCTTTLTDLQRGSQAQGQPAAEQLTSAMCCRYVSQCSSSGTSLCATSTQDSACTSTRKREACRCMQALASASPYLSSQKGVGVEHRLAASCWVMP